MTAYLKQLDQFPEELTRAHELIHDYSLRGEEGTTTEMQDQHLCENGAELFFSGHWSKMTVAHTTVLSKAVQNSAERRAIPLGRFAVHQST